ncbi:MAG: TolC family protein, partial [Planctomycetes bacterium]|nr:TolC family protein [Planctomycetota bacterium]
ELLQRRYDIAAAQQRIEASNKQYSAAQKDLLPSFRLTAEAGYASDELNSVFRPESFLWNLIGGITAPIFQGGKLRAQVSLRDAELLENYARYGQVVLRALYEVENTLSNEIVLRQKISELNKSVYHAEKTYKQARQQFENGLFTMTDVLDIQRSLLGTRIRLLAAQHALISNRVALHLALGGDFTDPAKNLDKATANADTDTDTDNTVPQKVGP